MSRVKHSDHDKAKSNQLLAALAEQRARVDEVKRRRKAAEESFRSRKLQLEALSDEVTKRKQQPSSAWYRIEREQQRQRWKEEKALLREQLEEERESLESKQIRHHHEPESPASARRRLLASVDEAIKLAEQSIPKLEAKIEESKAAQARRERRQAEIREELGPDSYEADQLADYHMVRELLFSDVIPKVLEKCHAEENEPETELKSLQLIEDSKEFERRLRSIAISQSLATVCNAIISEALEELVHDVIADVCVLTEWSSAVTTSLLLHAILAPDKERQDYPTNYAPVQPSAEWLDGWHQAISARSQQDQQGVYSHSQQLSLIAGQTEIELPSLDNEDAEVLQWKDIVPHEIQQITYKKTMREEEEESPYLRQELLHWSYYKASGLSHISIPNAMESFSSSSLDHRHAFLAAAGNQGSLVIFHVEGSYLHPVRLWRLATDGPRGVPSSKWTVLKWSYDSQRLAGIDNLGGIWVWSMAPGPKKKSRIRDWQEFATNGILPPPPTLKHLILAKDIYDISGFDSQANILNWSPECSSLGQQNRLAVGLKTGQVLQVTLPQPNTELKVEVFAGHKSQLLLVDFVAYGEVMITMDSGGYIFTWRKHRSFWSISRYRPERKYRLPLSELIFVKLADQEREFFSERPRARQVKRTIGQLNAERLQRLTRTKEAIKQLDLPIRPWHYVETDTAIERTYLPPRSEHLPKQQCMFYTVKHRKDLEEVTLTACAYEPHSNNRAKILSVEISQSKEELLVLLLCSAAPPKSAHLTLLQLWLTDMTVCPLRIDLPLLTEEDYSSILQSGLCTCAISQPLSCLGSRYVLVNILGTLRFVSLCTGQVVAASSLAENFGCLLLQEQVKVPPKSLLQLVHLGTHLRLVVLDKQSTTAKLLQLTDTSTHALRLASWRAWKDSFHLFWLRCPAQYSASQALFNCDCGTSRYQSLPVYLHNILDEIITKVFSEVCAGEATEPINELEPRAIQTRSPATHEHRQSRDGHVTSPGQSRASREGHHSHGSRPATNQKPPAASRQF